MNLKVGGHRSGAKVGGLIRRKAPEFFLWSCPSTFFGSKSTISRFDERFPDGQYSLVSFLFAVLLCTVHPPCPAICKSGGTCSPRAPWSRSHSCESAFLFQRLSVLIQRYTMRILSWAGLPSPTQLPRTKFISVQALF